MTKLFKDKTIEKKVMGLVRTAIEASQKDYDADLERAEADKELAHKSVDEAHDRNVGTLAEKHVANVFGKLRG